MRLQVHYAMHKDGCPLFLGAKQERGEESSKENELFNHWLLVLDRKKIASKLVGWLFKYVQNKNLLFQYLGK